MAARSDKAADRERVRQMFRESVFLRPHGWDAGPCLRRRRGRSTSIVNLGPLVHDRSMKLLALALLLLAGVAHAASPEQDYVVARDAAIARLGTSFKRLPQEQFTAQHTRALAALEQKLRKVVGPSEIKGFPAPG